MKEKLSALVDAELSEHERDVVLRELGRNDELRKTWERYHFARAVMRNELEIFVAPHFADRIAERLRDEPAPVLDIVPRLRQRALRGAAGFALAASVAALVIGGLQYFTPNPPDRQYARMAQDQVASNASDAGSAQGHNATNDDLKTFLLEHNEFMPSSGVNGVMSYVRLAAYSNR